VHHLSNQKKVNSKDKRQEQEEDEWQKQELVKQITNVRLVKVTKLENL
jgi:phenylpyruvate tautomerase PptA (4-oxalocrotonate tautomerase family)